MFFPAAEGSSLSAFSFYGGGKMKTLIALQTRMVNGSVSIATHRICLERIVNVHRRGGSEQTLHDPPRRLCGSQRLCQLLGSFNTHDAYHLMQVLDRQDIPTIIACPVRGKQGGTRALCEGRKSCVTHLHRTTIMVSSVRLPPWRIHYHKLRSTESPSCVVMEEG